MESIPLFSPSFLAPPVSDLECASDIDGEEPATVRTVPRVLIIDDCARTIDTFARYFKLEGMDVTGVTNGAAALAVARQCRFDVVVLDLRLQDVNGVGVLADLRATGFWSPVIMISGFGTAEEIAAAMKLGAADFLSKPVNCEDLVRMVRRLIGSSRAAGESMSMPVPAFGSRDRLAEVRAALSGMTWEPPGRIRTRVLAVLARAASSRDLTAGQFLTCAEGLHRVVALSGNTEGLNLALVALRAVETVQEPDSHVRHASVRQALDALGAADGTGLGLSERTLGRRLGISRSHLGRLLVEETGLGFCEWRRTFRMKRAAQELVDPSEHVRQIAYHVGYSDHGQFDHEFEQLFGLTPTDFRRTLAVA